MKTTTRMNAFDRYHLLARITLAFFGIGMPLLCVAAEDEDAALSTRDFVAPVMLRIDRDGFAQAQRLKAMNGVSNFAFGLELNPVGGPNDFSPCSDDRRPGIRAQVPGFSVDASQWVTNNFVALETYHIRYPRTGRDSSWVCPVLSETIRPHLPGVSDHHSGVEASIGRRVLTKWTYRNRYETPLAGKGNVKVFAGSFTYKIESTTRLAAFPGEGTATVKLFRDPDNGRWTRMDWNMKDPTILLLSLPLTSQKPTGNQDIPEASIKAGGCQVFKHPIYAESVTLKWIGGCENGLAAGPGLLRIINNSNGKVVRIEKGNMTQGRFPRYDRGVEFYVRQVRPDYKDRALNQNHDAFELHELPDWARDVAK